MTAIVVRIGLLALGLGMVEGGLLDALAKGSAVASIGLGIGILLVIAGTAGFMVPLLGSQRGRSR